MHICTYGHYANKSDDSHYSLKFYKGIGTGWHLAHDESGKVWFSKTGFFELGFDTAIDSITDWELTPLTIG
jgi:hypothetical protein